jgi:hypothetical protein
LFSSPPFHLESGGFLRISIDYSVHDLLIIVQQRDQDFEGRLGEERFRWAFGTPSQHLGSFSKKDGE